MKCEQRALLESFADLDGGKRGGTSAAIRAALAELDALRAALMKVNAIRNSIVGMQGFNFSEHAYPLVAALEEVGFKGDGYELSRKNLGTLMYQRDVAEAERDALKAERDELHETNRRYIAKVEYLKADRVLVAALVAAAEEWRAASRAMISENSHLPRLRFGAAVASLVETIDARAALAKIGGGK